MNSGDSLAALLAPVTLVVGKGGVGKTTVAAAIATRFAGQGIRTLVVTTDPAATLLSALGQPLERTVQPRTIAPSLDAWAFDTPGVREAFLDRWRAPMAQILDRGTYLDDADIQGLVDATLPGADEIFAVLALGETVGRTGDDAYARIIVDTAPTGHTLRLLNLPRSFGALVRLLDAMQEKHRFMVRALTHRYRRDAADALIAELRDRVDTLQRTLIDPARTSAVLVVRPEPVVIAESERYLAALALGGIAVAAVIVSTWRGSSAEQSAIEPIVGSLPLFTLPLVSSAVPERLFESLAPLDHRDAARHSQFVAAADGTPASTRAVPTTIEPGTLARSLTIVGGKGGVGKTTVACALAIAAADHGGNTLLVSTDPAPSVSDALGIPIGDDETAVPGVPRLIARQMDATAAFTAFRDTYQQRIDELFESLTGRGIDFAHDRGIIRDLLSLAPPGIDELYALTVLGDTLEEGRFQFIIVDPAPTGHLLRLLEMPALAVAWAHQLMRMMLKYKEVVALGEAAQDLLTFARRTRSLDDRLHDSARATAIVVALDEPLVRGETERLTMALHDRGIGIGGIIWNRALPATTPLPTAGSVPQFFAPVSTPAPIGIDAIRDWSGRWASLG